MRPEVHQLRKVGRRLLAWHGRGEVWGAVGGGREGLRGNGVQHL